MIITVDIEFAIGEIVYLKTDDEQRRRIVTAIKFCPDDSLLYELICGTLQSCHYAFEISAEEDVAAKVT